MKLAALMVAVGMMIGCAFDPACEPGEPSCEFAEEPGSEDLPDASNSDRGANLDTNNGDDLDEVDLSRPDQDIPDPTQCPPVQTCGDEPDHLDKPLVWNEEYGCSRSGFQSRTVTITDGICEGDSDWHGVRVRPCENRSFVVEAVVKPATPECLNFMRINIANDEGFRLCGAEGARCEQLPDGSLRASLLIQADDGMANTYSYFFLIDSTTETDAPYTITVSAFQ